MLMSLDGIHGAQYCCFVPKDLLCLFLVYLMIPQNGRYCMNSTVNLHIHFYHYQDHTHTVVENQVEVASRFDFGRRSDLTFQCLLGVPKLSAPWNAEAPKVLEGTSGLYHADTERNTE